MSVPSDAGVVVTGAARGIGRALAAKAVASGCRVVVNDLDADALRDVADDLGAIAVPGDAASAAGVEALVAAARKQLGAIDVWFGNAGTDRGHGLDATDDDWAAAHEVNVMAHVRAARLLVPEWVERGSGRYVVTASAAGLLTMIGAPAYSATKHAAVAFGEWLSATYQHRGVAVHAICPQGVQTDMLARAGELRELLSHDSALTPAEVADATWDAIEQERFLVMPHAEVAGYYAARAGNTDSWLGGMNKLQQRFEHVNIDDKGQA